MCQCGGLAGYAHCTLDQPDATLQRYFTACTSGNRFCFDRTYEYLLPAYLLVPPPAGGSSNNSTAAAVAAAQRDLDPAEVSAALERLRQALQCYVGTHPFQVRAVWLRASVWSDDHSAPTFTVGLKMRWMPTSIIALIQPLQLLAFTELHGAAEDLHRHSQGPGCVGGGAQG